MLVVLEFHGVNFGPSLFAERPEIGFGIFIAMFVSYVFMIFTIIPCPAT